jgi:transcription elongation factor Elf1
MATVSNSEPTGNEGQRPVYVYLKAARCPRCGSVRLRADHTATRSTGVKVRHSHCKTCGQKIRIVVS